jgi:hypothetical protein
MSEEIDIARKIVWLFYKRWREKPADSEGPSWEDAKAIFVEIRRVFPDATLEEHERAVQIVTFSSAARWRVEASRDRLAHAYAQVRRFLPSLTRYPLRHVEL